jgi:hypothetical protein
VIILHASVFYRYTIVPVCKLPFVNDRNWPNHAGALSTLSGRSHRTHTGETHDGASKGFMTTTSDFAPRLREDPLIVPWIPSRLELVNGSQLLLRLKDLAK